MSWIHDTDMNRLFERALTDQEMLGVYHRDGPESGFATCIYERTAEGCGNANWTARVPLDGKNCRTASMYHPELALYELKSRGRQILMHEP
jgi:hypothetical protein